MKIDAKRFWLVLLVAGLLFPGPARAGGGQSVVEVEIPPELVACKGKKLDRTLYTTAQTLIKQSKRDPQLLLVDVRRAEEFQRVHIPGSINIPLHFIKTKAHLKARRIVLVNQGWDTARLQAACTQLGRAGFRAHILFGGLPAWQRQGGDLEGHVWAHAGLQTISADAFFSEKDFAHLKVYDFSTERCSLSKTLLPFAEHLQPESNLNPLRPCARDPFCTLVIFNPDGSNYETIGQRFEAAGIRQAAFLEGGLKNYRKHLNHLVLLHRPREERVQTTGDCDSCSAARRLETQDEYAR